jgi:hypothetical protein
MNKLIMLILCLALSMILGATAAFAQSCAISPGLGHPLLPDTDCDRIVDIQDNCPFIANPLQQDADHNGLGDSCDLYIESIRTNPADFVYNGRAFNTFVTLENNRYYNIRNLKVRVFVPELGIESVQYIDNINVCDAKTLEFTLRAPMCVPLSDYQIIVEASFLNEFGVREIMPGITSIRVVPDKQCQSIIDNNQVIGNTLIDVMEIQDVYKGYEAVFPIKISNMEDSDKEYVFSVTGLDGWGSARLSPGSLVIVPKESSQSVDLYVKANDDASSSCLGSDCGSRSFVVTVQSGKEVQRFLLVANVKENPQPNNAFIWFFAFRIIIIIALTVLIIIACVIAIRKFLSKIKRDPATQYYA